MKTATRQEQTQDFFIKRGYSIKPSKHREQVVEVNGKTQIWTPFTALFLNEKDTEAVANLSLDQFQRVVFSPNQNLRSYGFSKALDRLDVHISEFRAWDK